MEKNDLSDNEEQVSVDEVVEVAPLPKPKRKITLTEEERKRRGDNLRSIVAKRKADNEKVNAVVKDDVIAVKKQSTKKISKMKLEKKLEMLHADSDSDSDSSVELSSSKKKRRNKQPTIIIKNYTLPSREHKSFDAEETVKKIKEVYKEEEPVIEPVRRTIGYFV